MAYIDNIARGLAIQGKNIANEAKAMVAALPKGLVFRGEVDYVDELPSGAELGDTYSVRYKGTSTDPSTELDGTEYAWGEYKGVLQWIPLGPDVSDFATREQLATVANEIPTKTSELDNDSGYVKMADPEAGDVLTTTETDEMGVEEVDSVETIEPETVSVETSETMELEEAEFVGIANQVEKDNTELLTSGGAYTYCEAIRLVAEGKCKSYVISTAYNPSFNTNNAEITGVTEITTTLGIIIPTSQIKTGDVILIIETDVPDRWYSSSDSKFYKMETAKVDLSGYQPLLTFDNTPTQNSNNPVKSDGIKTYVDNGVAACMPKTLTKVSKSFTYNGSSLSYSGETITLSAGVWLIDVYKEHTEAPTDNVYRAISLSDSSQYYSSNAPIDNVTTNLTPKPRISGIATLTEQTTYYIWSRGNCNIVINCYKIQ